MKKIRDEIDFLLFSNKNIKNEIKKRNNDIRVSLIKNLKEMNNFLNCALEEQDIFSLLLDYIKFKYIIKEIPDSYIKYSKGYIKDLGYYNPNGCFRTDLSKEQYSKVLECIQKDQINSIIPWIEFLCNKEKEYPMWFRYYIFNKIVKIGEIYSCIDKMTKRSKSTTASFISCDYDLLDKIYNLLDRYIKNKELNLEETEVMNKQFKDIYFFCFKNSRKNMSI